MSYRDKAEMLIKQKKNSKPFPKADLKAMELVEIPSASAI